MVITSIYNKAGFNEGEYEMTMEEFKKWLNRFDADGDGRISAVELRQAIQAMGGWFSRFKCKKGLKCADKNRNGYIDDNEILWLKDFALKYLGVRIVTY